MSVEWKRRKQLELELGSELTMVDGEVILTPEQCGRVESERHNRLEGCIIAYFKRFYLEEDPSGDFDFDGIERFKRECQQLNASAGYGMAHYNGLPPWYPDDSERRPCCAHHESKYHCPLYTFYHCRSSEHLANLYDVDVSFLDQRLDDTRIEIPNSIRPWVDYTDSFSYTLECFCHQATEYAERMSCDDLRCGDLRGWRRHYLDYIKGRATITPNSDFHQRRILIQVQNPFQHITNAETFVHLDHLATKFAELMCGDDLREQEWRRHYLNCIKDPTVADNEKKYP